MRDKGFIVLLMICAATIVSATQAQASFVKITGARALHIYGINDAGTTVGYLVQCLAQPSIKPKCQQSAIEGFIRSSDGTISTFTVSNAATWAIAINNNNDIAGDVLGDGGDNDFCARRMERRQSLMCLTPDLLGQLASTQTILSWAAIV